MSGRKLVLTPVDADKLLDESGIDYLYVTSRPPRVAEPGKQLQYPKGQDPIMVPLSKLSQEDQAFVRLLHESRSK